MSGDGDDKKKVDLPQPEGQGARETGQSVAPTGPGGSEGATFSGAAEDRETKKRRRRLVGLLVFVVALLVSITWLFVRYLQKPAPLPELLPVPVELDYRPHYLFSIYGVERPVGVTLSPQDDLIYVAETGGERLVKVFDRQGAMITSFSPPRTMPGERSPVYLATDSSGRVFVTDRLQHAVFVYDLEGRYLDTILGPDLTLSEYVAKHAGDLLAGSVFVYNQFESEVHYEIPGEAAQTFPAPGPSGWAPLGIRIDETDRLFLTDVNEVRNSVREIPSEHVQAGSWEEFNPPEILFGNSGQAAEQLMFPNSAVGDSRGWIYVSDSNNGRVSVWDEQRAFLFNFGQGATEGSLNLPRGAAIDARERLYVVDAVGQNVKVYDVSGVEPNFLFAFGDWGLGDGQFNYPNDIVLDASGRLYIADRENNRIQVWSY